MYHLVNVIMALGGCFTYAFVVKSGWDWFVGPATGLATPSLLVCLGIAMLVSVLTTRASAADFLTLGTLGQKERMRMVSAVCCVNNIVMPLLMLLVMWIVHLLI